jgi:hypothetical protein
MLNLVKRGQCDTHISDIEMDLEQFFVQIISFCSAVSFH